MKHLKLTFAFALVSTFFTGCAEKEEAVTEDTVKPPPVVSPLGEIHTNQQGLKFVRVATVEGSEPNKRVQQELSQFTQMNQQFNAGKQQFNAETDPIKKKEIEAKLNQDFERLNALKTRIRETYGVSVDRPYVIMIEESNLYLNPNDTPQPQPILEGGK